MKCVSLFFFCVLLILAFIVLSVNLVNENRSHLHIRANAHLLAEHTSVLLTVIRHDCIAHCVGSTWCWTSSKAPWEQSTMVAFDDKSARRASWWHVSPRKAQMPACLQSKSGCWRGRPGVTWNSGWFASRVGVAFETHVLSKRQPSILKNMLS